MWRASSRPGCVHSQQCKQEEVSAARPLTAMLGMSCMQRGSRVPRVSASALPACAPPRTQYLFHSRSSRWESSEDLKKEMSSE